MSVLASRDLINLKSIAILLALLSNDWSSMKLSDCFSGLDLSSGCSGKTNLSNGWRLPQLTRLFFRASLEILGCFAELEASMTISLLLFFACCTYQPHLLAQTSIFQIWVPSLLTLDNFPHLGFLHVWLFWNDMLWHFFFKSFFFIVGIYKHLHKTRVPAYLMKRPGTI